MLRIIGYVVSIVGLAIIAFAKNIFEISFLKSIVKTELTVVIAGAVVIAIGIALILMESGVGGSGGGVKQAAEEVPIFEGEGKNRKIVGYKRGKK